MTEISDPSTPEHVRRYLMGAIRIAIDTAAKLGYRRSGFEFFEFTDGNNDESGLIAVDLITAQRFEIRIREEE